MLGCHFLLVNQPLIVQSKCPHYQTAMTCRYVNRCSRLYILQNSNAFENLELFCDWLKMKYLADLVSGKLSVKITHMHKLEVLNFRFRFKTSKL